MTEDDDSHRVAEMIIATTTEISGKLVGLGPVAQNGILADLVARFLAGWAPQDRDDVWIAFVKLTWQLVEPNEKLMFGEAGHPCAEEDTNG
jgi:hypothetical protein